MAFGASIAACNLVLCIFPPYCCVGSITGGITYELYTDNYQALRQVNTLIETLIFT